ncbi:Zinc finger RING-type [Arabidopsis suecica]|uniref:Zinc finger RING-type n=1 Tax=Arabidopsis suecica TaxID=45249 RepID=A0A8T2A3V4_ARASU|nr:Zinc finger RING-type [Arabidopsis suecica]
METTRPLITFHAHAVPTPPSFGPLNTLIILRSVKHSDGSVSPILPQIRLKLRSFTYDYVHQVINNRFHDVILSYQISDRILLEARNNQVANSPLFMVLSFEVTETATHGIHPILNGEDSCSICLLEMSTKSKPSIMRLNCCRTFFHEPCLVPWLKREGTCPLCRSPLAM